MNCYIVTASLVSTRTKLRCCFHVIFIRKWLYFHIYGNFMYRSFTVLT
eukprot:UN01848